MPDLSTINFVEILGHAYMTSPQFVLIVSVNSQIITNIDVVTHKQKQLKPL